ALDRAMARAVPARRQRLLHAKRQLDALSPLNVLGRGYAIVEGPDGRIIADAALLHAGDRGKVRMRDGRAAITVEGVDRA
ncbi:MAG: exodeoxyribonuclease VII large subunit, partial [Chloroflexota bacterium]|nr:exodeoxyribonuclease VII large subunit [Chloroflexota bacterium]